MKKYLIACALLPCGMAMGQAPVTPKDSIIQLSSVDVVATGYQNLRKSQTTSAYTEIKPSQINRQINATLKDVIEGQVAGLRFTKRPFYG